MAAWIYSEGTPISYPAILAEDNAYYLTHAWDGQESVGGALFFDRRDTSLNGDENLILYGHNMKDGSMFASLNGYREQAY